MGALFAIRKGASALARLPGPPGIGRPAHDARAWQTGSGHYPAAPILSGTNVTPETALGVAAVFSAINRISTDLAGMPRNVFRINPDGGREIERTSYLGDLNDLVSVQPNDDMDAFKWLQDEMGHVLGRGNGFNEIVRKKGFVRSIEILHPARTRVLRTDDGKGKLYYELDNKRTLWPEDVLHFSGMGFNGVVGFSPLTLMRQTIGLSMAAEQFGASFFGNGAFTSGWIKMAGRLTEAALNNFRRTFNQMHQGAQSAHQIGFLEEGKEWVPNQISPEDAQMILTRAFQVEEIARIFSIPPSKIGDYSKAHMANVEESNSDYVTMTLLGWVLMLEAQMNVKLLSREDRKTHTIGINMDSLMRGNITARMLKVQTMRNAGAWNANDIRTSEGLNPLPAGQGGEIYAIQGQYVPLKDIGKQPVAPPMPGKPEKKDESSELEERLHHTNGVAA